MWTETNAAVFRLLCRNAKSTCHFCACLSFCICLSSWNNSAPNGRTSMKFDTWGIFSKTRRKSSSFIKNLSRIRSALHEDLHNFLIKSLRFLLITRNVSDKIYRENKTQMLCSIAFISENRADYNLLWKKGLSPYGPQMTIYCST